MSSALSQSPPLESNLPPGAYRWVRTLLLAALTPASFDSWAPYVITACFRLQVDNKTIKAQIWDTVSVPDRKVSSCAASNSA